MTVGSEERAVDLFTVDPWAALAAVGGYEPAAGVPAPRPGVSSTVSLITALSPVVPWPGLHTHVRMAFFTRAQAETQTDHPAGEAPSKGGTQQTSKLQSCCVSY